MVPWQERFCAGMFEIPEVTLRFPVCLNSVRYILYTVVSGSEQITLLSFRCNTGTMTAADLHDFQSCRSVSFD
uniref:Uncharacterized protein n=1 Tax=Faecalibaculum rodentium TaxID=1702221 RepID=A0A140DVY5_9FIRM|nr:hypothetical protein AALO17_16780 [Faecalibaculum rodentium]